MWRHKGVMFVPDVIDGGFRCGDGGGNGACGGGDMRVIWWLEVVGFCWFLVSFWGDFD